MRFNNTNLINIFQLIYRFNIFLFSVISVIIMMIVINSYKIKLEDSKIISILSLVLTVNNTILFIINDKRLCESWSLTKHSFKTFVSRFRSNLFSSSGHL